MSEMILPGVYIEVRPEALIIPGRVSVNNVGIVGTASRGPVDTPTLLATYSQAREIFGEYDAWNERNPDPNALSLVRALELAFRHGATTVYAVRIASGGAAAGFALNSGGNPNVTLRANSPGTWGNEIEILVTKAEAGDTSFIEAEKHPGDAPIALKYPIARSARNRVTVLNPATGRVTPFEVFYEDDPAPTAGQVRIDTAAKTLEFFAAEAPNAADQVVTVSYVVPSANSRKVTLKLGTMQEVYVVASGEDLARDINANSALVTVPEGDLGAGAADLPDLSTDPAKFELFGSGTNPRGNNGAGVGSTDFEAGFSQLLNENVHILVAAGQSHHEIGDELAAHVAAASNDENKRERIGIVGSALTDTFDDIRGHNLNSDRVVFVAPGIVASDAVLRKDVTLPGSYAAAAIAGLMSSYDPHVSLTNKPLPVAGLQRKYTNPDLKVLLEEGRVFALQEKLGFKVVRGITTSTNTAWKQITTRRIVDYAKFGVRSAADPYIGMLNNERVRGALRATINSFLTEMVEDEMLIGYDLNVSATREQERQGICVVTMVVRPVFSIDFIKVTMFLE
ncbi:phage tail sheath C-terminal domain-containing protein [Promineifilum sp.]|uniref:phage tail sheath C-terminal domain-containing protein n=1 Tax=Promineifilum sp. TaxID=2664178 RepID=UPI0035B2C41D